MADARITELPALTTVLGEDLLAIVDDPTGTASTKKIRVDDFQNTFEGIGARVYNSASIEIANITEVALTFNSERYDTDSIHDTGSNTERLTCNTTGKYLISASLSFATDAGGNLRILRIYLNNTTIISQVWQPNSASGNNTLESTCTYELSATNYVTAKVYQNSGGAIDASLVANSSPEFMMHRIG